jgi:hypothetical protein
MNFDPAFFESKGIDFGAMISEDFLNRFAIAHHRLDNSIYHVKQHISNFGLNIDIQLDVNSPIVFDLSPIADSKFHSIWKSHLIVKGANANVDPPTTPPNLGIFVKEASFTFIVYKEDGTLDFQTNFLWDVSGTCAVVLDNVEGTNVLRLEPIKIQFKSHEKELIKEIDLQLKKHIPDVKTRTTQKLSWLMDNSNPEKLVLYLLNQMLATQMTNFIQQFTLPKSFELMNDVRIEPGLLSIKDKVLSVGCKVGNDTSKLSTETEAELKVFLSSFRQEFNREFSHFDEEKLKAWKPEHSTTLRFLDAKKAELISLKNQGVLKGTNAVYPENVIVFTNSEITDAIANQYFNIYRQEDYEATLIPNALKAKCGWSVKLSNADTTIMDHGLKLTMNAKLHGYAGVACLNSDPKHWGEWIWFNLGANVWPDPDLGVIANPKFKTDGIYLSGELSTRCVKASIDGLPIWANSALSWIIGLITSPLFSVIDLLVRNFDFKIINYPSGFPGTSIVIQSANWRFNQLPVKKGSYLVFSADTFFE